MAIHRKRDLDDRTGVFRDRIHAGEVLAGMLDRYRGADTTVLAVPAGGIPVGATLSRSLGLSLDVAVVSKITLPWNTEVGYGAVAFDGTVLLNEDLVRRAGLRESEVLAGIEKTRAKVRRRSAGFRGTEEPPRPGGATVILVDDGLASGFTLRAAVEALEKAGAAGIVVAVPTGHRQSVEKLAPRVEDLYCANLRSEPTFAVADAYLHWTDVGEEEAKGFLP